MSEVEFAGWRWEWRHLTLWERACVWLGKPDPRITKRPEQETSSDE